MATQEATDSRSSTPSVESTSLSASPSFSEEQLPVTTTTTTTRIVGRTVNNPYRNHSSQKKGSTFTGGAALARQKAVKKKAGKRILRPGESSVTVEQQAQTKGMLPLKMNSLERFFACLLRSRASDFATSSNKNENANSNDDAASLQLWQTLCHRVGLTAPTERLRAVYENQQTHFNVRAALVLEEARHAIASSLRLFVQQQPKPQPHRNKNSAHSKFPIMQLSASLVEPANSHGHVKITLQNQQRSYTPKELFELRPGGIIAIRRDSSDNKSRSDKNVLNSLVLGVIVSSSRDQLESKKCFRIQVFRPDDVTIQQDDVLTVTVLVHLVTELRCFEALTTPQTRNITFLHSLLGRPSAVHTRFEEASENTDVFNVAEKSIAAVTPSPARQQDKEIVALASTYFHLPQLNETQEQAATQFLHSKPSSLTLVQGPPGTGKSTLLLSIICRYLTESVLQVEQGGGNGKRLLVSAPTNKAVSVLATRYLSAVRDGRACPCNAIVVGDVDKLLGDSSDNSSPLRSIFLYTWLPNVIDGYTRIRAHFLPKTGSRFQWRNRNDSISDLCQLAVQLQHRLTNSLPYLSKDILRWTQTIAQSMTALEQTGTLAPNLVDTITKLLNELQQMPNEAVWEQLLLSAHVIFCTLAGAGSVVMKKTSRVDDFIVDEAAASTEAELCIPLHLRPARLLAVGDPLQLPATVLSPRAMKLGLATSLHERLMYQCQYPHVMLNMQYRMSVSIARFPSLQFYQGRIGNGFNVTGPDYIQGGARLLDRLPYIFLQINDGVEQQISRGGSYSNRAEANQIAELVMQLRQQHSSSSSSSSSPWCCPDRLRVITFYQAQVALIQRCLEERGLGRSVPVATVDSSQGCEADIVLISFVRTKNAGFLTDDRRLNVALTRARYQLICVGHVTSLVAHRNAPTLQRLVADADERGLVRSPWRTTTTTHNNNWTARLDMFYGRNEDDDSRVLDHAFTGPARKRMRRT